MHLQPLPVVNDPESDELPAFCIYIIFDDPSSGTKNLSKTANHVKEKERFYRGIHFFSKQDLKILETIGRSEFITYRMQGKNVRPYLRKSVLVLCPEYLNVSSRTGSSNAERELIFCFKHLNISSSCQRLLYKYKSTSPLYFAPSVVMTTT